MYLNRRQFLGASALVGAQGLRAAGFWEKKAFPDWSAGEVDRILTDSPWAKQLTVPFEFRPVRRPSDSQFDSEFSDQRLPQGTGLPGGGGIPGIPGGGWPGGGRQPGSGTPGAQIPRRGGGESAPARTEIYLTVRWSSALPVRRALALQKWGRAGLDSREAIEWLSHEASDYHIEIFGFPAMIMESAAKLESDLAKSAALYAKNRGTQNVREVVVPPQGEHLSAALHFPRFETLTPTDGQIELAAASGTMKIRCRFPLKEMIYEGRLAV